MAKAHNRPINEIEVAEQTEKFLTEAATQNPLIAGFFNNPIPINFQFLPENGSDMDEQIKFLRKYYTEDDLRNLSFSSLLFNLMLDCGFKMGLGRMIVGERPTQEIDDEKDITNLITHEIATATTEEEETENDDKIDEPLEELQSMTNITPLGMILPAVYKGKNFTTAAPGQYILFSVEGYVAIIELPTENDDFFRPSAISEFLGASEGISRISLCTALFRGSYPERTGDFRIIYDLDTATDEEEIRFLIDTLYDSLEYASQMRDRADYNRQRFSELFSEQTEKKD